MEVRIIGNHTSLSWQQNELVIDNQETFKEYEISVQSANSQGLAPPFTVERMIGYSGQDGMSPLFYSCYLQLTDFVDVGDVVHENINTFALI